ncbi:ATP-binding protein [Myxococcota bacterium]|nr:ATP-binding protein [Myxococcota bacterium]
MYQTTLPVVGPEFRDRHTQLARVLEAVDRLERGAPEWLAVLGPRKVGKTSLLLEAARRTAGRVVFAILDVFDHLPVSAEVFRLLALRVVEGVFAAECGQSLEATTEPATYRAVLAGSPRFARLSPELRELLLGLREVKLTPPVLRALVELPERLAIALDRPIVLAIDEFQELADLKVGRPASEVLPFLRSAWQKHRHVAYMVSGSARTMMTDLVSAQRSPFFGHFSLLEVGPFTRDDAVTLVLDGAPPGRPIPRAVAERAFDVLGGSPFHLQLLGEQLAGLDTPLDEGALKEALSRLLFHRTGRLAMFYEAELARIVGRSPVFLAILETLARERRRASELGASLGLSSSSVANYLTRLRDAVERGDDQRWGLVDPVMALWLRWRAPGGAAVPMTVLGDEGEKRVAQALAELGFDLIYQSRASRGAFDLLALRGGVMLGVQVKRSVTPLSFPVAAWRRMEAEAKRLGWLWIVAATDADGRVAFLDPARVKRARGFTLAASAEIDNLLVWLDVAARGSERTRSAKTPAARAQRGKRPAPRARR